MFRKYFFGLLLVVSSLLSVNVTLAEENLEKSTPVSSEEEILTESPSLEKDLESEILKLEEGETGSREMAEGDFVGKDSDLEEGEFGITSVGDVKEVRTISAEVGDEVRTISTESEEESFVGENLDLKEGEFGITSVEVEETKEIDNNLVLLLSLIFIIGGLFSVYIIKKK